MVTPAPGAAGEFDLDLDGGLPRESSISRAWTTRTSSWVDLLFAVRKAERAGGRLPPASSGHPARRAGRYQSRGLLTVRCRGQPRNRAAAAAT